MRAAKRTLAVRVPHKTKSFCLDPRLASNDYEIRPRTNGVLGGLLRPALGCRAGLFAT